jgi:hypothetical protein
LITSRNDLKIRFGTDFYKATSLLGVLVRGPFERRFGLKRHKFGLDFSDEDRGALI